MRLLQWPSCEKWRSFAKKILLQVHKRISGERLLIEGQLHWAPLSSVLFGIVWVLLQAFARWCGWGADSGGDIAGEMLSSFFCVCGGSGSFCHDWASHCSCFALLMRYLFFGLPSSNAAIAMQHHPGNIHQSVATPLLRHSVVCLIQLPNVIDTISKR